MVEKSEANPKRNPTTTERTSERELVVTRTLNAPAHLVYAAWTKAELFQRWWVPKSVGVRLLSCELDVRVGGTYRLVFAHPVTGEPMPFFGRYSDVVPNARIVWSNEEAGGDGPITTVTFEETHGTTRVVVHDLYPSKQALDDAIESGSTGGLPETFDQLEEFLAEPRA